MTKNIDNTPLSPVKTMLDYCLRFLFLIFLQRGELFGVLNSRVIDMIINQIKFVIIILDFC